MTPSIVVFDIGGVLVDWQPELAWADEMDKDDVLAFLDRINFHKLNPACDAGAKFADIGATLEPDDARMLAQYVDRFARTVPNKVAGTWDLLYRLRDAGVPLHAITNWSAETWPEAVRAHPELGTVFGTTIVSGAVGMIKPGVAIYHLLCQEIGANPADCVFIDDGLHNCVGAKAAGMDAIHFTGAAALETALQQRGLL